MDHPMSQLEPHRVVPVTEYSVKRTKSTLSVEATNMAPSPQPARPIKNKTAEPILIDSIMPEQCQYGRSAAKRD
jgi:hypothetical protein